MQIPTVFLQKDSPLPLYEQLYRHLAGQIVAGTLAAGARLPGKRTAAALFGVSVNTVDQAYQMLAAEGYVDARPRSGFVVNALEPGLLHYAQPAGPPGPPPPEPPPEPPAQSWAWSFASGDIDASLFPARVWNRLFREVLAEAGAGLFDRGGAGGDAALRAAISDYLGAYRGVRCNAGQVVVGAGLETLTAMLARLLAGGAVALESPGYPKTAHIFKNEGIETCYVPVDDLGMQAGPLAKSGARAAYLTPSHQFPTGCVMPVGRRGALLQWAAESGGFLIEDDYDSEFRFDGRPLPSLQGLDSAGCVVYAGTFSRSLAPGLRVAYLVLPPALQSRWQAAYGEYACTVSRPEQHTLARFMDEGHFARSLNRMRNAYRAKRDLLLKALSQSLPQSAYRVHGAHTGHYLVLQLLAASAEEVAQKAMQQNIRLRTLQSYRAPGAPAGGPPNALVLGYGGFPTVKIGEAAAALAALIVN